MITYHQQWMKLTEAYIRGDVNPFHACNCFVGNLLNNKSEWGIGRGMCFGIVNYEPTSYNSCEKVIKAEAEGFYTVEEIIELEAIFMNQLISNSLSSTKWEIEKDTERGQEILFKAFRVTLDKLKDIHISKGEVIDEVPVFVKRKQLANV